MHAPLLASTVQRTELDGTQLCCMRWITGNAWHRGSWAAAPFFMPRPATARKVRQYVVNREWRNIRAGWRRNHFPFHVWLAQNSIGQRDYLSDDVCKKLLTAHQNYSEKKIAHEICSQWANLLWAKICSINLLTENHELPFILLAIQVCTHDTISIYT